MNRPTDLSAAGNRVADPSAGDDTANTDLRLQQALRALPPPLDAARLDALQARVLAQWQAGEHGATTGLAAGGVHGVRGPASYWLSGPRRGWVLASGLFVGVSLATVFWLQRPDPAMDELLQPDVLSQMAIGEM